MNLASHTRLFWILLVVISLASLYSQENIGQFGLMLPFNVIVWALVGVFVIFSCSRVVVVGRLNTNVFTAFWAISIFLVLCIGLYQSNLKFEELILVILAFTAIGLFVFSVQQYNIREEHIQMIFEVFVVVALCQALIGMAQVHDDSYWFYTNVVSYPPLTITAGKPVGVFQQVNMFATFMSVAILMVGVLIIHFSNNLKIKYAWLLAFTVLFSYLLFITGSRAGLLSLVLGLFLMIFVVLKYKRNGIKIWLYIVAICLGLLLSQVAMPINAVSGLGSIDTKIDRVIQGADVRQMLFQTAWIQFLDSPFYGHGIGNYLNSFLSVEKGIPVSSPFYKYSIHGYIHPHNELLFWIVNSGVVVLISLIVLFIQFIKAFKLAENMFLNFLILSVSIPLIVQANLSYMFSLSAVHLFLLLFLMAIMAKGADKARDLDVLTGSKVLILPFSISITIVLFFACWHTLVSTKEVVEFKDRHLLNYVKTKEEALNTVYLKYASDNPIYKDGARKSMLLMVDDALEKRNAYEVIQFIRWVNQYEYLLGEEAFLKALITSYLFIKRDDLALTLFNEKKRVLTEIDQAKFNRIFNKVVNVSGE